MSIKFLHQGFIVQINKGGKLNFGPASVGSVTRLFGFITPVDNVTWPL